MNAGPSLLAPDRRLGSDLTRVCAACDRGDSGEPQREDAGTAAGMLADDPPGRT